MAEQDRVVEDVRARLAALRARRAVHADPGLCDEVEDLVVVCSSSRSGSSLLGELLRASDEVVTTSGEINPHLVLPGLGRGPDVLADPAPVCATGPGREVAQAELSLDLGWDADVVGPAGAATDAELASLADHVSWRLTLQWPHEAIDPGHVARLVGELGPPAPGGRAAWFVALLSRLRAAHPGLDPRRYDLGGDVLPEGPAGPGPGASPEPILEMAPFVVPRRWRHATRAQVRSRPVVLVTPRNAFRLPLLSRLFPRARVRVVQLVRNPGGAVNGLVEGWHHPAFAAAHIDGLAVRGYSDAHPERGELWCFDLPPGWRALTAAPLEQVCAAQWRRAHEATLAGVDALGCERHVLAFEDLVGSPARRRPALAALADFLGIDHAPLTRAGRLPVVMATGAPRPARWRGRRDVVAAVTGDEAVTGLADELGYGPDPDAWA